MKVIVAGGSGFVGRHLVRSLRVDQHEVVVVSRSTRSSGGIGWDAIGAAVDGADAVVNLAGESIGGRWTGGKQERILRSRVETTNALVGAIAAARRPPLVLINASGIDYAGDSGDAVVDEDAAPGDTFLGRVCNAWEDAAARSPVRWVAVRTPLTIARDAPAVRLMALPFRLFVGGRVGTGRRRSRCRRRPCARCSVNRPTSCCTDSARCRRSSIDSSSATAPCARHSRSR